MPKQGLFFMKKKVNLKNPILVVVGVTFFIFIVFFFGVFTNTAWIENSVPTIFVAIATLLVGSYAFTLYKKQKEDIKRDAANIISLEIQNAEKVLKLAQRSLEKDLPTLPSDVITMPTESWNKNKYLFVSDFDSNQWEAISNFYSTCMLFDEAVRTNASYFQKNEEQIRVNIQKNTSELTKEYIKKIDSAATEADKAKFRAELRAKSGEQMNLYLSAVYEYTPKKPVDDAKLALDTIKLNISLPGAISKLKELVK